MDAPPDAAPNSLGLDLDTLRIKDELETSGSFEPPPDAADETNAPKAEEIDSSDAAETAAETPVAEDEAKSPTSDGGKREREKKQPYVNPERVKTGGAQRDKLSEEELTERMIRIREQNEKIKQRRADVQADEDAFKKTQEAERVKAAKTKKVQENIDRTREQNARRKMEKIQTREWDSGKPARDWKPVKSPDDGEDADKAPRQSIGIRGVSRGGRGRGRGRAQRTSAEASAETSEEPKVAEEAQPPPETQAADDWTVGAVPDW